MVTVGSGPTQELYETWINLYQDGGQGPSVLRYLEQQQMVRLLFFGD